MNSYVVRKTSTPLAEADTAEQELIDQLRSDFSRVGKITDKGKEPSEQVWINNMNRLFDLVHDEDPRRFLHWDVIQKAMFITNAMYVLIELSFLKKQSTWSSKLKPALEEDKTGAPIPYWTYPSSSGNLIHHAYHIGQLESNMGIDVSKLEYIVECGGGYGSMCRLVRNLGFKGTYVIYDLPHFSALQKYYLQSVGIKVFEEDPGKEPGMSVRLETDIDRLKAIIGDSGDLKSLFLATWSLSEMPLELRTLIAPLFSSFNHVYFAYQTAFEEVNNVEYFQEIQKKQNGFNWKVWEVASLPTHYYMAGTKS